MKTITIIFTWTTTAGIQDTYIITKTKNDIFDNTDLENKLQQLSPLPNTAEISNYTVDRKQSNIHVVLIQKDLIQTLPLELTLQITSSLLPTLRLNKAYKKQWDNTINNTASLELFSHPTAWQNLTPKACKNAVALLKNPEKLNTFLDWVNTWIGSPKGAKKFLHWIETFGLALEELYENHCKANRQIRVLYALVVSNIHKIDEFSLEKALEKIQGFPNILASINITLAFLRTDKNTKPEPDIWYRRPNVNHYVNFQSVDLSLRTIQGCNFSGFNLKNADFSFTKIIRSNFSNAILIGATFLVSHLISISLRQTNLQAAKFDNTIIINTTFCEAKLTDTLFKGSTEIQGCDFAHTVIPLNLKQAFKKIAGLDSSRKKTKITIYQAINGASNIQELLAIYHNNIHEFLTIQHTSEFSKAFGIFFKSAAAKWIASFTALIQQRAQALLDNNHVQLLSAEEKALLAHWEIQLPQASPIACTSMAP